MARAVLLAVLPALAAGFQAPLASRAGALHRRALHGLASPARPWARPDSGAARRAHRAGNGPLRLAATASLDPDVFVKQSEVLAALSIVNDPSREASITSLGAVKELEIDKASGAVSFSVELGAPDLKGAVKDKCVEYVSTLPWVSSVRSAAPDALPCVCGGARTASRAAHSHAHAPDC